MFHCLLTPLFDPHRRTIHDMLAVARSAGAPTAGKENADATWKNTLIVDRLREGAVFQNIALTHAADIMRSESARIDAQLAEDFTAILRGNTVYMRNFVCAETDFTLYDQMKAELIHSTGASMSGEGGLIEWSKHQVFDNPTDISPTFNLIIDMLAEYFDVDVYATRLNYYRDGSQWKPQHHDSHAYGGRAEREDFTVGITLGSNRKLVFIHEASKREFNFPQTNGDCFAFTGEVNRLFTHGVPRVHAPIGDRFSIIAWGRRRSLNERNGGVPNTQASMLASATIETMEDAVTAAQSLVSVQPTAARLSNSASVNKNPAAKKKKQRLQ
ncbi:hypothetical protein STCU_02391 [Strigomonas culicis]|uniref:Fe2OG dioxygenase domain-containing protein n=1 Tax=Strigomonas culicis TaxID=28005 RepID=S9UQP6_9TRYP|nr:hypothetical protein STCU_02391 [Strigomonas culicis]|eukprot:EPY33237.1 hypothetical protein STCU_02391 [Strigomonas culicis]